MPPQKFLVNGYVLWVKQEGIPRLEAKIRRGVTLTEACQHCDPWWKEMSEAEKDTWKKKAKDYKTTEEYAKVQEEFRSRYQKNLELSGGMIASRKKKKLNEVGPPAGVLSFYGAHQFTLFRNKRLKDVKELIDNFDWTTTNQTEKLNQMRNRKFKLFSITPYYEIAADEAGADGPGTVYPPAEIVIITFSMAEGIAHVLHRIIVTNDDLLLNDDKLMVTAMEAGMQDKGHRIPLIPEAHQVEKHAMRSDYSAVMKELSESWKHERFMFVIKEEYNQVLGGIDWLFNRAINQKGRAPKPIDPRLFVCMEDLVTALYNWKPHKPPSGGLTNILNLVNPINPVWNAYDCNENTLCRLHVEEGTSNCAQARAKKAVYGFFLVLEAEYEFKIEDDHIPDMQLALGCCGDQARSLISSLPALPLPDKAYSRDFQIIPSNVGLLGDERDMTSYGDGMPSNKVPLVIEGGFRRDTNAGDVCTPPVQAVPIHLHHDDPYLPVTLPAITPHSIPPDPDQKMEARTIREVRQKQRASPGPIRKPAVGNPQHATTFPTTDTAAEVQVQSQYKWDPPALNPEATPFRPETSSHLQPEISSFVQTEPEVKCGVSRKLPERVLEASASCVTVAFTPEQNPAVCHSRRKGIGRGSKYGLRPKIANQIVI